MIFTGTGTSGRALRVLVTAAFCVVVSAAPGHAQFDFLFGFGKPAAAPPFPDAARPTGPSAGKTKHGNARHDKPETETATKAKTKSKTKKAAAAAASPDAKANTPPPDTEAPPAPYDPELLRLAEILGALTYLDELCATGPSGEWRAKMQTLLEADAKTAGRKERLAGSYNRGFRDFERTYHFCTPNAQAVISRFLVEGASIAHDVVNRYGSS